MRNLNLMMGVATALLVATLSIPEAVAQDSQEVLKAFLNTPPTSTLGEPTPRSVSGSPRGSTSSTHLPRL